ncbi:hypothetical protein RIF29_07355 [Crotalaria pallida]|uniref:Uncharacterized protein n=1 Tax=Crotalaria pallida TaxID=3830 RepID=A0AAN9J4D6_CROPI
MGSGPTFEIAERLGKQHCLILRSHLHTSSLSTFILLLYSQVCLPPSPNLSLSLSLSLSLPPYIYYTSPNSSFPFTPTFLAPLVTPFLTYTYYFALSISTSITLNLNTSFSLFFILSHSLIAQLHLCIQLQF